MINFRIIARALSQVLILEGLFMAIAGLVSYIFRESEAYSFLYSAIITIVTGVFVFTPLRDTEKTCGSREGYIIITGIWILLCTFSTLPFLFSGASNSFTDAFFESMSGFTTTNATVYKDPGALPHGILFWRSLTQWLGGMLTITLSMYILPVTKTLNIQLPTSEFSGQVTDKIHPRVLKAAKILVLLYAGFTLAEVVMLIIGKIPLFDAVCHAFTTISAGGFSTHSNGIAAFESPYIRIVITAFMFFAGTNLALVYFYFKGDRKKITGNNEFALYSILTVGFSIIVAALLFTETGNTAGRSLLSGFFHVVSIITTTGFYFEDYTLWHTSALFIIFLLMFSGAMAGSASGGIKMIRLLIISRTNRKVIKHLLHPEAVLPVHVDKKTIPGGILLNLMIFFALYLITVCSGAIVISFMDYDLITSLSTSASIVGNIGPGIGSFGPFSDFSTMPVAGKWFLSLLMLLGRLELMGVVILISGSFYKN